MPPTAARLPRRARKLTDEQRSAIAAYFAVYKGQASRAGSVLDASCHSRVQLAPRQPTYMQLCACRSSLPPCHVTCCALPPSGASDGPRGLQEKGIAKLATSLDDHPAIKRAYDLLQDAFEQVGAKWGASLVMLGRRKCFVTAGAMPLFRFLFCCHMEG